MLRAITVIASTLMFAVLGVVISYLHVSARQAAGHLHHDTILVTYLATPIIGGIVGLVLSILIVMFMGPRRD